MTNLQHPDTLHLQAARGWLELGNHLEANEELEKITASLRAHPEVLEVRWRIYAKAEKWEGAFEIALTLPQLMCIRTQLPKSFRFFAVLIHSPRGTPPGGSAMKITLGEAGGTKRRQNNLTDEDCTQIHPAFLG
jgi:hypothetical protein